MKKKCPKCGKTKSVTNFNKNKTVKSGLQVYCKKCANKYRKEHYHKNKEHYAIKRKEQYQKHKQKARDYHLKYSFGITLKDYDKILKNQNYCCAICKKHYSNFKRNLDVDHNHKTKFIRGILCSFCNGQVLKYLCDDKKRAQGVVDYLTKALKNDKIWR